MTDLYLFHSKKYTPSEVSNEVALLTINKALLAASFEKKLSLNLSWEDGFRILEESFRELSNRTNQNISDSLRISYGKLREYFHEKRKIAVKIKQAADRRDGEEILSDLKHDKSIEDDYSFLEYVVKRSLFP